MKLELYKTGGDIVAFGLILIVVGVPLAYTTGIFDFALLPKHLVLSLGVGVAAVGWLLRALSGKLTVPRSPVLLPLVAFSAWSLVSFPNTTHPLDSLHEILDENLGRPGSAILKALGFTEGKGPSAFSDIKKSREWLALAGLVAYCQHRYGESAHKAIAGHCDGRTIER